MKNAHFIDKQHNYHSLLEDGSTTTTHVLTLTSAQIEVIEKEATHLLWEIYKQLEHAGALTLIPLPDCWQGRKSMVFGRTAYLRNASSWNVVRFRQQSDSTWAFSVVFMGIGRYKARYDRGQL
jgi:hypothetical protein